MYLPLGFIALASQYRYEVLVPFLPILTIYMHYFLILTVQVQPFGSINIRCLYQSDYRYAIYS